MKEKNELICQISDKPVSHADQKVFARFCLPYIQLQHTILYLFKQHTVQQFPFSLKTNPQWDKNVPKIVLYTCPYDLILNNVSYNCTMKTT